MIASTISTGIPYLISLAAVLGTFHGIRYTNRVNIKLQGDKLRSDERTRNREMLRAKGEQLYATIDEFEKCFRQNTVGASTALIQQGRQQAVDLLDMRACSSALLTIQMLTRVYFPSNTVALEELESHWQLLGSSAVLLVGSDNLSSANAAAKKLVLLSADIADSAEKLQKGVIASLQELHADVVAPHRPITEY